MSEFKQWIIWGILALGVLYAVSKFGFAFVEGISHLIQDIFGG